MRAEGCDIGEEVAGWVRGGLKTTVAKVLTPGCLLEHDVGHGALQGDGGMRVTIHKGQPQPVRRYHTQESIIVS